MTYSYVNSAGLLAITPNGGVYLIMQKKPYNLTINWPRCKLPNLFWLSKGKDTRWDNTTFLEKFLIPRGHIQKNEYDYQGAIREFIEETQLLPRELNIINYYFNLEWIDPTTPNIIYKYKIFVAFINNTELQQLSLNYYLQLKCNDKINTLCFKLKNKTNKFESLYQSVVFITIDDYEQFFFKNQQSHYTHSNYKQFFIFVRNLYEMYVNNYIKEERSFNPLKYKDISHRNSITYTKLCIELDQIISK